MAIFWDGASYHNSQEFRELLKLINQEKAEEKWWINCLKFAPNAPLKKQNTDFMLIFMWKIELRNVRLKVNNYAVTDLSIFPNFLESNRQA